MTREQMLDTVRETLPPELHLEILSEERILLRPDALDQGRNSLRKVFQAVQQQADRVL